MYRILIVEDDVDISELLQSWLTEAGYQTAEAEDGLKALEVFESGQFDLVLLDLMLPRLDGFGVCEWIRKRSDVPIVMLTALDGEDEQLRGYDLRIDDYVTKPFSMPVLLRKIGAILRRCRGEDRPDANLLRYRDLTLDLDAYTVMRGDRMLELTNREFECLRELLQKSGARDDLPDACQPHLELRLSGRRSRDLQPYQESAPQTGRGLHPDGQRGGLSCGQGLSTA